MPPRDDERTPEPTARPTGRLYRDLAEEAEDKVVPVTNVGGAAPTPLGLDSGGDLPGPEDDLSNLAEPEPPDPAEVDALHEWEGEGDDDAARE